MNHREINPDEAIDRLLSGLRDAESPRGMERRILSSLKGRAVIPRRLPLSSAALWTVAAAGVAIIASFALSIPTHRNRIALQTSASMKSPAPANGPLQEAPATLTTRPRSSAHRAELHHLAHRNPAPSLPHLVEDSIAFSDAVAPSHPAPPMPLTEQERLLVHLVHKGDPVELAMLDPKFRSSEEANSRDEFERFFPPSPSPIIKPLASSTKPLYGENK